MKTHVKIHWLTYLIALSKGRTIETVDSDGKPCLVVPGWVWDAVYQSELHSSTGLCRTWHYPGLAARVLNALFATATIYPQRIGTWLVSGHWMARLILSILGALVTTLLQHTLGAALK